MHHAESRFLCVARPVLPGRESTDWQAIRGTGADSAAGAETRRAAQGIDGMVFVAVLLVFQAVAAAAAGYTPAQTEALAVRMAQVDAVNRLTEMVLGVRLASGETVREALGAGSRKEIALRVFLRSARMVGPARVYSDGVAEVDVQAPADAVAEEVGSLTGRPDAARAAMASLVVGPVTANLSASGRGTAPPDLLSEAVQRIVAAPRDELPAMYPAGWRRVTAAGRVLAARAARIDAYDRMAERLRGILLGRTETVADLADASAGARAAFDAYVRSLPVADAPRFMPDRIAEVQVQAPVAGLIEFLKHLRGLHGAAAVTEERLDRLSVQIKSERIAVTGRGMPPPDAIRARSTAEAAGGAALPDWATEALEAVGTADLRPRVDDAGRGRLLAVRSAKARAQAALEKRVDAIALDGGTTVRERAARDPVFRRDLETFLDSARTVAGRSLRDGRAWEVTLRLPLLRLYEFSRGAREGTEGQRGGSVHPPPR